MRKATLILAIASVLVAHCPAFGQSVQKLSDSVFLPTGPAALGPCVAGGGVAPGMCDLFYELHGTMSFQIKIDRVVGPGIAGVDVNSDGQLLNPATLIASGVVSPEVTLKLSINPHVTGGQQTYHHTVQVNGWDVPESDYVTSCDAFVAMTGLACADQGLIQLSLKVPIEHINFGTRVPGQAPTPGVNTVTVLADPNEVSSGCECNDLDGNTARLQVTAMYPIVLVHGWNAGPWVWGPRPTTLASGCRADDRNPMNGGENFVQALIAAGAPYDCTLKMDPQVSVLQGRIKLGELLSPILGSFGAQHVHLIAHSKAGLISRAFLKDNGQNGDPTIGVISLTTLDTPHLGSVMADTVTRFNEGLFTAAASQFLQDFLKLGVMGPGSKDMTVGGVETLNSIIGLPPDTVMLYDSLGKPQPVRAHYYSTSADADTNGDGMITESEAAPDYPVAVANTLYQVVARAKPLSVTAAGKLIHASVSELDEFVPNDIVVAVPSARYFGFTEIVSFVGNMTGRNHARARCGQTSECPSDVAPLVLGKIAEAELDQPIQ